MQRQPLKQSFKTAVALNSLSGTGRLIKALIIEDSKKKKHGFGGIQSIQGRLKGLLYMPGV